MNKTFDRGLYTAGGFALAATLFGVPRLFAAEDVRPVQVKPVFSEQLPNVPGKTLTGVHVTYAPGGKSSSHAHAGSVYAYVLSGSIRSQNSRSAVQRQYIPSSSSHSGVASTEP